MKKFVMEKPFLELFPDCEIGILVCNGINNQPTDEEKYAPWLRENEKLAAKYFKAEEWTENPVVRTWRDAFRLFKTKNGGEIGYINPLVDIYNGISLKYGMPVGGENIDAFDGDIRLAVAEGGEYFVTYGSDKDEPALPGEVVYKDNTGAICRCWNWRESVRTMLTEDVKNAFMIIEQVNNTRHDELEAALDELKAMIEKELGGTVTKHIANKENPEVVIEE